MECKITNKKWIDNLLALSLIISCVPGWYLIESIGMNKFWLIFGFLNLILAILIIKICLVNRKVNKNCILNKFNLLIILYIIWTFLSYFINGRDIATILYIGKMDFLIFIYFFMVGLYMYTQDIDANKYTILTISNYIFKFGILLSFIALYQYIFKTNYIFGIKLTFWPSFNPAALYQNVNGFGMYLFLSIVSGAICIYNKGKHNKGISVALLVVQCYVLYLTISRTSIIVTIVFITISILISLLMRKSKLLNIMNKRIFIGFIIANIIMILTIFNIFTPFKVNISEKEQNEKTSIEMLQEKNSRGLNYREIIWGNVIKNSRDYVYFGDGLKYSVVKNTNINEIINKNSDINTRISYHNTLIRYFASNGLLGLCIFLLIMLYAPFILLFRMIKRRKLDYNYLILMFFQISILMYMQMEEVYIGEIGLIQLVNMISLVYANRLVLQDKIIQ